MFVLLVTSISNTLHEYEFMDNEPSYLNLYP